MKFITNILRIIVGLLFIVSGFVKLVDPMGFSYKLNEYFAPEVLNLTFLEPFALILAIIFVIFEMVLGVFLLLGYQKKFTLFNLLWLIIMFTFLTFYSAYFNKVTDCGCFGDALKLTPWESFTKDIVLLIMIIILILNEKHIKLIFNKPVSTVFALASVVFSLYMTYSVMTFLPWIDFRAYNIGSNWIEGKKSAEELGLQPDIYETYLFLIDPSTKKKVKIAGTEYAKKYEQYKDFTVTEQTETVLIKEGYSSKMQDFDIENTNGESVFNELMLKENLLIIIAKDINHANKENLEQLQNIAKMHKLKGGEVALITANTLEESKDVWGDISPIYFSDKTVLKTIVRANPGVILLDKAVVVNKWNGNSYADIRDFLKL